MNRTHKSFSMLVLAGAMLAASNARADANANSLISRPSQLVDLVTNLPCPNPDFSNQNALGLDRQIDANGVNINFNIPTGKALVLTEVSQSFGDPGRANHPVHVTLVRASPSTGNPIDIQVIVLNQEGSGTARFSFPTGTRFSAGTTACLRAQDGTTLDFITGNGFAHGFLIDDF